MEAAGPGGFDLSALSSVLNDPSIRGMAEQIASDPAFAQMTQALQSSLVGGNAGAPGVDPSKYAEAMGSVLQNPNFMSMAERLGQQIMQARRGGRALGWRGGGAAHAVGRCATQNVAPSPGRRPAHRAPPTCSMPLGDPGPNGGRRPSRRAAVGRVGRPPWPVPRRRAERAAWCGLALGRRSWVRAEFTSSTRCWGGWRRDSPWGGHRARHTVAYAGTPVLPPPLVTPQQDPRMATMMQSMQDPGTQAALEARLTALKDDPELAPIMAEVEAGGPAAMMKYWDNPVVLEKLSKAMGSAFDAPALGGGLGGVVPDINGDLGEGEEGEEGEEEEGEEEEEEGEPTVHSAASSGNVEQLKSLLDGGANADEADDEGRTPLHFSSGYGEVEVVKILLAASASVDAVDHNDNTPLHYAAGYGQPDCVALLIDAGADRDAKNKDGKTAQEVAELNGQDASVSLLAAAGAGGAAAEGGAEGGDA